ncbi:MAG: RNA polymerase sigma factor SigJ [Gammaproteobacteria bacterium]|nr:RNA polymerase sigma factor SigJ [Gammaproteobacteria bacterium]MCF6259369.1 RNA polymerase sigma factor SigJ [Gammaproteobacteria bacterium]
MSDENSLIFEHHRMMLEGLAYRMLGTLSEAQDVVQETYLKWHVADINSLNNPRAWLITVCSRIAMNYLKSARKRREVYVGEWLPEPYLDEKSHNFHDPSVEIEFDDTVSIALLLALEKLSPTERAVFLLHDIFELSFDEISKIIGKNCANCRQLATRARKRVHDSRPRFQTTPKKHQSLFDAFLLAARQLDTSNLTSLLAEHVELYSDGGGKVEALSSILRGAKDVAKFFVSVFSEYKQHGIIIRIQSQRFNGSHGILVFEDDILATALTIETHLGCIIKIYAVRNPSKLSVFSHDFS